MRASASLWASPIWSERAGSRPPGILPGRASEPAQGRRVHRWLSIAFTLAVVVNALAVTQGKYAGWLGLLAGLPLAPLLLTGLYLFVLPYATRGRGERPTD